MEKRLSYTVVGLFVIILSVSLVSFVFWLAKYGNKAAEYDYYHTYFTESVSGLNVESLVKLRGVEVGRVKEISINKNNSEEVEILLEITKDTPVKVDSYTSLDTQGITGLKYIELKGGSKESKQILTSKVDIATIKSKKSLLSSLFESSESITNKIDGILDKVEKLFNDKNLYNISLIVANLSSTTSYIDNNKEKIGNTLDQIDNVLLQISNLKVDVVKSLDKLTKQSGDFFEHSKKIEDEILPSFNKLGDMSVRAGVASDKTSKFFDEMYIELEKGEFSMASIIEKNLEILNETLHTFQDLALKLDDTVSSLKESPSDLLYKSSSKILGPGESDE